MVITKRKDGFENHYEESHGNINFDPSLSSTFI